MKHLFLQQIDSKILQSLTGSIGPTECLLVSYVYKFSEGPCRKKRCNVVRLGEKKG